MGHSRLVRIVSIPTFNYLMSTKKIHRLRLVMMCLAIGVKKPPHSMRTFSYSRTVHNTQQFAMIYRITFTHLHNNDSTCSMMLQRNTRPISSEVSNIFSSFLHNNRDSFRYALTLRSVPESLQAFRRESCQTPFFTSNQKFH
jgi:hypothetical protein